MPPNSLIRETAISNRYPRLRFNRVQLRQVIATLDAHATEFLGGVPAGELSLVFLDDQALAQLHADFLADPTTTDVITFEGNSAHGVAGEICVSVDAAQTYAKQNGHDFATELLLYVVHGWLHLAGYDDLQPAKKRIMRRAEAHALKILTHNKISPGFALRR
jgi:probable rRNA maturation factor